MREEREQSLAWISPLIVGKHDGGLSMEGDGLGAEGEFLLFGFYCSCFSALRDTCWFSGEVAFVIF